VPDSEIFFAYPSKPDLLRETIHTASDRISRVGGLRARRWEDLHVSGRLVIDQILGAIDRAHAGVFEITHLNENVLFELGYAVGRRKRVFPIIDAANETGQAKWHETRILSTVGYTGYRNSEDIFAAFLSERPDLREASLFEESIEPALKPAGTPAVLYVTNVHGDDASGALTRVIRSKTSQGIRLIMADPRETAVQPLTWYAQQIHDAAVGPLPLGVDGSGREFL
jgi:hypothetical protein